MAVFQSVPYINPAERLADAEALVTSNQSDLAFAQQLTQQAILGVGDAQAARQLEATIKQLLGDARINQQIWTEQAKGDKESLKKTAELIKSQ